MPYFIFQFCKKNDEVAELEYIDSIDNFKQAKTAVRKMRAELDEGSSRIVRMVFADNQDQAASMLQEKREAPILKEWEK